MSRRERAALPDAAEPMQAIRPGLLLEADQGQPAARIECLHNAAAFLTGTGRMPLELVPLAAEALHSAAARLKAEVTP